MASYQETQSQNLADNLSSPTHHSQNPKKAIVLLNMGGPNSLSEVKMFLQNMFNDPLILPIKSNFFRSLLASFITNKRLEEAQHNYRQIGGKSPLVTHTFNLCKILESLDSSYFYTYVMRYTPPFAFDVAKELKNKGIENLVLFSLYPHYSHTTIKSSYEDFIQALKKANYTPKITYIPHYFEDLNYNQAIIERICESLKESKAEDFHLVFSAHSLPQKNINQGDPYQKEILENVAILKNLLQSQNLNFKSIATAYQSKIGPIKWLEPNLKDILPKYKNQNLLIYPIAFSMDNSETDFELSIQYRALAQEVGICDYRVCQCLNASQTFAKAILKLTDEALRDCHYA